MHDKVRICLENPIMAVKLLPPAPIACTAPLPPTPEMILCKQKGVVSPYYCCRKFSYDPLMRVPHRQVLPELDPKDFTLD